MENLSLTCPIYMLAPEIIMEQKKQFCLPKASAAQKYDIVVGARCAHYMTHCSHANTN